MTPDLINGLFELGGAFVVLLSVFQILRDQGYAGLNPAQTVFFQVWGMWNLYFYPSLDQIWSLVGGLALVSANTAYLICLWRLPKLKR